VKLSVVLEHRFFRLPDGTVWTKAPIANEYWQQYLDEFDVVTIVARVKDIPSIEDGYMRVDGSRVRMSSLPFYLGPLQFFRKFLQIRRSLISKIDGADAVILHAPGILSVCAASFLMRSRKPYGMRVVGDPHDVFSPGAMKHPLRRVLRWYFSRKLRKHCAFSCGCSYVTERKLQQRYPAREHGFTTNYSSIQLGKEGISSYSRPVRQGACRFVIVTVGSLMQPYKGVDVLINAVKICVINDLDVSLVVIGDGNVRASLESLAVALNLGSRIKFLGQLRAGSAIRDQLDKADLFVLASRAEGLPRSMIEAMARAVPCIGTNVGGIPELISSENRVSPGNSDALAEKIQQVLGDPERMRKMSEENLKTASCYEASVLRGRKTLFYQHVRKCTRNWLRDSGEG